MYISPDKKYKFVTERVPIQRSWLYSQQYFHTPQYNIIVKIYDNITGTLISTINMDEYTCARALSIIAIFPENFYQTYDSYEIDLSMSNMFDRYILYIENIFEEDGADMIFQIRKLSYEKRNIQNMISIKLSLEDLADICFKIFFNNIIDLIDDFPDDVKLELDPVENFILSNQYIT